MSQKFLTELKMRESLLHYMKDAQAKAAEIYLDLNKKLECGIALPSETLFSIVCDDLFNGIEEETIFFDETTQTELLLSRVIVDENPYKLEFVYTVEQRDGKNNLLSSNDYEIGEEAEVLHLLEELGVVDDIF